MSLFFFSSITDNFFFFFLVVEVLGVEPKESHVLASALLLHYNLSLSFERGPHSVVQAGLEPMIACLRLPDSWN